ncbi:MAG: hypothetical protein K0S53_396 [Bacteroidetes bacterium]|jgi:hypothetical protein|nr:hypothetical protein [Bacteroidota bacterium]
MSIFTVNFSGLWKNLTPPVLRKPVHQAWGDVLLEPVQYLRDLTFNDYADGSSYSPYTGTTTYVTGDRAIYTNRGVYESISGSTNVLPTDTNYWNLVNSNYIGVRERVKYNAQKMGFEHGLNRWFQCTGIYINNNPILNTGLLMGNTGAYSSALSNTSNPTSASYLINNYSGSTTNCYTIYVPTAVYNGLGVTNIERENVVRSFADNYNLAGMIYNVVAY